jgi:hypothetical protein
LAPRRISWSRTRRQRLAHLPTHRVLVGEQLVERARAHRLAQRQLGLAVQGLGVIADDRHRLDRVRHLERHDQVDPQRDLVGRHDLLAGDVGDLLPEVERLPLDVARTQPEDVQARAQLVDEHALAEQQHALVGLHAHALQEPLGARQGQHRLQLRVVERQRLDVERLDLKRERALPESMAARAEDPAEAAVLPHQGPLVGAELDDQQLLAQLRLLDHEVEQRVLELRREDADHLEAVAQRQHEAAREPVGAGRQCALEVAVAEPQTDLVVSDSNLEVRHVAPPFTERRPGRGSPDR